MYVMLRDNIHTYSSSYFLLIIQKLLQKESFSYSIFFHQKIPISRDLIRESDYFTKATTLLNTFSYSIARFDNTFLLSFTFF